MTSQVDHPKHYTSHPSGVECITITKHMNFLLGNVFKYIWRVDQKGRALEDLKKAKWYLEQEIERREKEANTRTVTFTPYPGKSPWFPGGFVYDPPSWVDKRCP